MFDFDKQYYAITITPNRKDRVYGKEDLEEIIRELDSKSVIYYAKGYELKKDKTLHVHLACIGPVGLRYASLQKKGYQIFIQKMFKFDRWEQYCRKITKNSDQEQQMLWEHQAYHTNLFLLNSESSPSENELPHTHQGSSPRESSERERDLDSHAEDSSSNYDSGEIFNLDI